MKKLIYESLREVSRVGEVVEFSKSTRCDGAHTVRFSDCDIIIDGKGMPAGRGGAKFSFAKLTLEHCRVTVRSLARGLDLSGHVRLHHCRVSGGPCIEPLFGPNPHLTPDGGPLDDYVIDCDFSAADLRDARFYLTDVRQLKLPGWPCVTVVAADGDAVFAPPSESRPALTKLVDEVEAFDWGDAELARSMKLLVFGVGIRRHEASVQVCQAEDAIRRGAGSEVRLLDALRRFAHPAIRY